MLGFPRVDHCCLVLCGNEPFISDADLIQLGDAWGYLKHLDVRCWDGTESKPRTLADSRDCPTLSGLLELARRCPILEHIHLPELDVRTLPKRNTSLLGHPVRELSFDSVCYPEESSQGPRTVADVLNLSFLKLDVPLSLSEASRACNERQEQQVDPHWKDILKFVQATQLAGRDHLALSASESARSRRPTNLDFEPEEPEADVDLSFPDREPDSESSSEPDSESSSSDPDSGSSSDADSE